jgi:PAS domain S-box-containing protein
MLHRDVPGAFPVNRLALSLLDNTGDALIGLDCTRKIQRWNSAAETIYGYTPSEIIGKDFTILFASDNEGDERVLAEEKLNAGAPVRGWEVRQLHKNGSIVHT